MKNLDSIIKQDDLFWKQGYENGTQPFNNKHSIKNISSQQPSSTDPFFRVKRPHMAGADFRHHIFSSFLACCLLFFFFVFPEVRRTIAEMRTATPQQDDYGAANGADLMDGTSEDVQPPCSLAIKSPSFSRACITLSISQSYIFFFFSTRGVMTTKWQSR